ncbi:MAG: hypothetical protein PUD07_00500 [bacterium]|nr:hypothetical protein [bacterium]
MKKNKLLCCIILLIIVCLITIFLFKKNYYVSKNEIIEKNKGYAIYVKESGSNNYTMQNSIPKGNYSLNLEKTICENGGTVSNYDKTNGTVLFTTLGSDKCTLYFDYSLSLKDRILADNPTVSTRTDFSVTNVANTTGTIYTTTATEDGSTVYYYSGNTTNNWVLFGGFYWRIIRTNEDGSVRLLYSGTSPDTTEGYIGTSKYNVNNNDPMYVGYMYGTTGSLANNRTNTNGSAIKQTIDTWYENNLLTDYDKYISKTAIYCNDRSIGSGTYSASPRAGFYYAPYTRLLTNKTPTYKCGGNGTGGLFESTQAVEDKFSASPSGGGNGQLKYGVALMTADELVFAGGVYDTSLSSPYAWYYTNSTGGSITGNNYWRTMSPSSISSVWYVYGSGGPGNLSLINVFPVHAVRPVISLKSCVNWSSGDGTPSNPYIASIVDACISAEN